MLSFKKTNFNNTHQIESKKDDDCTADAREPNLNIVCKCF